MRQNQKGRPATKPVELKDGFYLELKNKGSNVAVKIRRENMQEIEDAIQQFKNIKNVVYLGQVSAGRWLDGKNKGKKTT